MKASSSTLTIGKKIGLGFALVLLILVGTGTFAVYNMRSAAQGSTYLSEDYVPEFQLSTEIIRSFAAVRLEIRTYGLTGEEKYLQTARKELAELEAIVGQLGDLARRTEKLTRLKAEYEKIPSSLKEYVGYIDKTEQLTKEIEANRKAAVILGAEAEQQTSAFILNQEAKLKAEVEAAAKPEAINERYAKIRFITRVRVLLFHTRLAYYQASVNNDFKGLKATLDTNVAEMDKQVQEALSLVHTEENRIQLVKTSEAIKSYQKKVADLIEAESRLEVIMEERTKVAATLEKTCTELVQAASLNTGTISKDASRNLSGSSSWMLSLLFIAVVVGVVLSIFITRIITGPLAQAVAFVRKISDRDLTVSMEVKSTDEVGQICTDLNNMAKGLRENIQLISLNAQSLSASSEEMSSVSSQVSSNAEETASQANIVSAAAEQVSKNIGTVATGTEEMSSSIREIAKNASEAAKVANHAATVAEKTNQTVAKLGDSSQEIGNVIKVITSIAEQTNLLALNATIEAARAGEAGKGFAVVANEVKELAKQTAKATEDIGAKIKSIQGETKGAVDAIREISTIIAQINQIQTVIASAVEEQAATTNEISKNVSEAATGASEIAKNIGSVSQAAKGTTEGANQTSTAAHELARLSAELKQVVDAFRIDEGASRSAGSAVHARTPKKY